MISLLATCLIFVSAQGSVAFPLDYYTADELAKHLSTGEVKYVADSRLEADVYILSLPPASAEKQMALLADGLGLDFEPSGTKRNIRPNPAFVRSQDRLRGQIVGNIVDQSQASIKIAADSLVSDTPPKFPQASAEQDGLIKAIYSLNKRTASTPLALRCLESFGAPDQSALADTGDTVAFYPRSALPRSLTADFEGFFNGPLTGLLFGYQTNVNHAGAAVTNLLVPIVDEKVKAPLAFAPMRIALSRTREQEMDLQLKGVGKDPFWQDPGLKKSDLDALAVREHETEQILAGYADVASKDSTTARTFSADLGFLCQAADLPLIYKVNQDDERLGGRSLNYSGDPVGFEGLFGKKSGYTAEKKDGVLVVRDELSILPSMTTTPLAALVETLHAKNPGHSILDVSEAEHFSPLYMEDLARFTARTQKIEKETYWSASGPSPLWMSNDDMTLIPMSRLLIPLLERLTPDEWISMGNGQSVQLDPITDFTEKPELLDAVCVGPMRYSRATAAIVYQGAWIDKAEFSMGSAQGRPFLRLDIDVRNSKQALLELRGDVITLASDDPIVKRYLHPGSPGSTKP